MATKSTTSYADEPLTDEPVPPAEPLIDPVKEGYLTAHPSPGMGSLPLPPHPDDTLPGTSSEDDPVPDPENPTGPPLTGERLQALKDAIKAKHDAQLKALE
jgi:hypothetical protein